MGTDSRPLLTAASGPHKGNSLGHRPRSVLGLLEIIVGVAVYILSAHVEKREGKLFCHI